MNASRCEKILARIEERKGPVSHPMFFDFAGHIAEKCKTPTTWAEFAAAMGIDSTITEPEIVKPAKPETKRMGVRKSGRHQGR